MNQSSRLSSKVAEQGSKASQHQHEDQHIVPSTALRLDAGQGVLTMKSPDGNEIAALPINNPMPAPACTENFPPLSKKKKEKRRPRDKILRDPESGKTAMKMREQGAFLGYAYHRPKAVEEVVAETLREEYETVPMSPPMSPPALGYWTQPLPREEIC